MSRKTKVKHINLKTVDGLKAHKVIGEWEDVSVDELEGFYLINNHRLTPVKGVDDSTLAYIEQRSDALDPYMALLFLLAIELDVPVKALEVPRVIVNKTFAKQLEDYSNEWHEEHTLWKPDTAAAMSHLAYSPRVASDSSTLDDNTVYYVADA